MKMIAERKIAEEINNRGLRIKAVSEKTGVRYSLLQPSLKGRRELRADEMLAVCAFLNIDPMALAKE